MAEKETCAESQAEKEMREARVPTPKSLDELQEYIKGLVEREHGSSDRRQVFVRLTPRGAEVLEDLSASHRQELRLLAPRLVDALGSVVSLK